MFDSLSSLRHDLAVIVAGVRPAEVGLEEVDRLVEVFAAIERLGVAGKLLLAARAAEVPRAGTADRDSAGFLARVTGSSVGAARAAVETSERLAALPQVAAAVRAGQLNETRANVVADAAAAAPEEEECLLRLARRESMKHLRERARSIKAAADTRTAEEKHDDLVRTRRAVSGVTPEGAGHLDVHGPPEQMAEIDAAIAAHRDRLFRARAGTDDAAAAATYGNLSFDAVLAMARASVRGGDADKPIAKKVLVRVDRAALLRGEAIAGETVDLPGYGPIPVSTAQELMRDQTWHALLTAGVAVAAVTHGQRKANSAQRTALDWTEPGCCVRGCPNPAYVEIDHVDDWARTRRTSHGVLQRLCHFHHDLKTRFGWRYEALPDGRKRAVSPDEQRERRPTASGPGAPEPPPTGTPTPSASTDAPASDEPLVTA